LGILLYIFMLSSAYIGWQHDQNIHESLLSELYYIMSLAIFGSGLPPILLVIYFLILGKMAKDFGMGFIFVFTFILVHFYVVGVSTHTEPIIHIPFQLVELAIVVGIMRYWHTKRVAWMKHSVIQDE